MTLSYPLGLLGLLAIPFLILIYLIKNKYTEQVVPSTYIWELSEKFLKRKNPISRIAGIISLILQIFAVVIISFAVAHPVFTLKGQAEDYCFVVDCSGSMNFEDGNKTRFDKAKDYVKGVISSSVSGSTYTLVEAGASTGAIFKGSGLKDSCLLVVDSLECSYTDNDLSGALATAQEYFTNNPAMKVYLLTDKAVETSGNVQVVSFASQANNYALSNAEYGDGEVRVTAKSYGADATLNVKVYADGNATASAEQEVVLAASEEKVVTIPFRSEGFSSLRISIEQDDDMPLDNTVKLYNTRHDSSYKTLIVSEKPFFIETALDVFSGLQKDVIEPDKYDDSYSTGYGLYIFDSFSPDRVPADGAVWFINPVGTTEGAGFNVNGVEELSAAAEITATKSTSSKIKYLLEGYDRNQTVTFKSFVRCNPYRSFDTILKCNDDYSVMFVGSNVYGNREAVFAFDMKWSDFPLSYNYIVIINNLLNYTFPAIVENTAYYCGDSAQINVLSGCTSLRVDAPDGTYEYLDTSSEISECLLDTAGEYKITAIIGNEQRNVYLYAQLPLQERETASTLNAFVLSGEAKESNRDGYYDDMLYLFIVLAVIIIADWGMYCYEQYQLR